MWHGFIKITHWKNAAVTFVAVLLWKYLELCSCWYHLLPSCPFPAWLKCFGSGCKPNWRPGSRSGCQWIILTAKDKALFFLSLIVDTSFCWRSNDQSPIIEFSKPTLSFTNEAHGSSFLTFLLLWETYRSLLVLFLHQVLDIFNFMTFMQLFAIFYWYVVEILESVFKDLFWKK